MAFGDDMLVNWRRDFIAHHTPPRDPTLAEWKARQVERAEIDALLWLLKLDE